MKKISLSIISLLLICFLFVGCTFADSAKLVDVQSKYDQIVSNEQFKDNIFKGNNFLPSYKSDKLNQAINRTDENLTEEERKFTLLKASAILGDF